MAHIVTPAESHDCLIEIAANIPADKVGQGAVVECTCGNQFIRAVDPQAGAYWRQLPGHE